jgi:hypothetical protein
METKDKTAVALEKPTCEAVIKVTAKGNLFLDQIIACLKLVYDVETTSPKIWSDDKQAFFQYATLAKRSGP